MMAHRRSSRTFRLLLLTLLTFSGLVYGQSSGSGSGGGADPNSKEKQWGPFFAGGSAALSSVFVDIEGSRDKYRTDYNYLPGFSLGELTLNLDSPEHGSAWMDYLKLRAYGFGNSYPYQNATLTLGKRARYEFRADFRKQKHFFSIPSLALGGHGEDSARRMTDITLRLYPQRHVTLEFGYYRNYNYGTAFSSTTEFLRDFELIDPRRSLTQDFRVGATVNEGPLLVSFVENIRKFKDDPDIQSGQSLQPDGATPQLHSSLPVRLSVPSSQVIVRFSPSDRGEIEARYTYSSGHVDAGRSDFLALQIASGISLEEIIKAVSTSNRPEHRFQLTGRLVASDRISVGDAFEMERFQVTSSFFQTTTMGGSGSGSLTLNEESDSTFKYSIFRYRPYVEFRLDQHFSLTGGFEYSKRHLEQDQASGTVDTQTDFGFGGFNWHPHGNARLGLQFEKGTANDTFTRLEPKDFTRWRFSAHVPIVKDLSVDPHFTISDLSNKTSEHTYDAKQRQGGFELTYTSSERRTSVSIGYTRFNLNTLADIQYFLQGSVQPDFSHYRTQIDFIHANIGIPIRSRLRANLGYHFLRDPRSSSFPLRRHYGEAAVSLRTYKNWVWDLHWQHVSYNETQLDAQDYMANVLGLTLRWSF